jgi:hypothetical protein
MDGSIGILIEKKDSLLYSFVDYCRQHPELRLWQALRNWSGYTHILGSTAPGVADPTDPEYLENTYNLTTKGPKAPAPEPESATTKKRTKKEAK